MLVRVVNVAVEKTGGEEEVVMRGSGEKESETRVSGS